jgi:hypothetical protein
MRLCLPLEATLASLVPPLFHSLSVDTKKRTAATRPLQLLRTRQGSVLSLLSPVCLLPRQSPPSLWLARARPPGGHRVRTAAGSLLSAARARDAACHRSSQYPSDPPGQPYGHPFSFPIAGTRSSPTNGDRARRRGHDHVGLPHHSTWSLPPVRYPCHSTPPPRRRTQ